MHLTATAANLSCFLLSPSKINQSNVIAWSQIPFCAQMDHTLVLTQSADGSSPAGAGKTNIAMLTVLHELAQHVGQRNPRKPDEFKIVYVAPMKALAAEVAAAFCASRSCMSAWHVAARASPAWPAIHIPAVLPAGHDTSVRCILRAPSFPRCLQPVASARWGSQCAS